MQHPLPALEFAPALDFAFEAVSGKPPKEAKRTRPAKKAPPKTVAAKAPGKKSPVNKTRAKAPAKMGL